MAQNSVILVALLGLPVLGIVLGLVQVKEASLLLIVLVVEAVDCIKVVCDEKHNQDPFEAAWGLNAEDYHEDD